jgi:NAD(P)-dependent dehydrogenase (short-subunit alcohol dehydrogenase family)
MTSIDELYRVNGKVALVTGGYGGIGEAVCRGLGAMGAKVAIAGHNGDRAAACAKSLQTEGRDAWATSFEATSVAGTQQMVDEVVAHFGKLDILVNCIGLNREEKAEEVTEETPALAQMMLGAIQFVLGDLPADTTPSEILTRK